MKRGRELLLLAAFTILLHVPFLHQPVQGDEVTYLDIGQQVLRQPLTPLNFTYVFQGRMVDASGHPHPPVNGYLLALIWLVRGHFSLVFFHACYVLFAVGISFAAYALAARFTSQPLWAALLVAVSPIVEVSTNTVAGPEGPALMFLLIGAAAFFWRRFWIAGIALTLAGGTELQALALPPILLLEYAVRRERPPRAAWLALAAPYVGLAAWQSLQWSMAGQVPGAVLLGYAESPAFGRLSLKGLSAIALLEHLGVLVTLVPLALRRLWGVALGVLAAALVHGYPWWERALLVVFVTLGVNALVWLWQSRRVNPVLAGWCLFYFAFAAVAFFAGASRYLLPLVAPAVLLFVLQFQNRPRWLALALGFNLLLGLNLSFAAYEFARVYAHVPPPAGRTFLVNGEWGFRYYMLQQGGRMLEERSLPMPGEWIVSSELSLGANYDSLAEETAVPLRTLDLTVRTPLRLLDRHAHSGFSAVSSGLLPFSFSSRPLDRITYARTSPFLYVPGPWTPTEFSGRLVYLAVPGQAVRLPWSGPASKLHFALFGRGKGLAVFSIRNSAGDAIFEQRIPVDGSLWDAHVMPLPDTGDVTLSVEASPELQAGWGDLVTEDGDVQGAPDSQAMAPFVKTGDLRNKPQLISGWYSVEDGAWRWMMKRSEVVLRTLEDPRLTFAMQLYFPPGYMQHAGGPVTVSVRMNGKPLTTQSYAAPGSYRLEAMVPPGLASFPTSTVNIRLNRTLPPSGGEQRDLGAIVTELGFVTAK
jgi:hypothetical protein